MGDPGTLQGMLEAGDGIPANYPRFIRALRCTKCGRHNAEIRISVGYTGPPKAPMRTVW